ncbi:MAG TPA: type II secretion system F family protein [Clostridiaceae bacterium]
MLEKPSLKDIAILCKQFNALFSSGISILEILNILSKQARSKPMKNALLNINRDVEKGNELAQSMKKYKAFPDFFVNMIYIGELSGRLEEILKDLSIYYDKEYKRLNKMKASLAYPITVFIFTIFTTNILIIKVIPMYAQMLISMGAKLPLVTVMLINFSAFMKKFLPIGIILIIIIGCILLKYTKTGRGKIFVGRLKLSFPIFSNLYKKVYSGRFSRALAIFSGSGVSFIKAINESGKLLGNNYVENLLYKSTVKIEEGSSVAAALGSIKLFPQIFISMVAVGEETGNMEDLLNKASDILDEETSEQITTMTAMLEPAMIIFLSFIVGFVILSLILPMYSIMDSIN